jgi:hypothetical protein
VIADWLHLLRSLSKTNTSANLLPTSFLQTLSSFRQANGGFNAFLGSEPDIQGTYLAITFFKNEAGQNIPRISDIQNLLDQLALDKGGFSPAIRISSSNPMSTQISLEVATILDKDTSSKMNDQMLKEFAQQSIQAVLQPSNQLSAEKAQRLYYTFKLLRYTHLDSQPLTQVISQELELFVNELKDNQPLTNSQLAETFYLTQLIPFDNSTEKILIHDILLLRNSDGAFGVNGHSSLQSTYMLPARSCGMSLRFL